jgi:uncharacterized phiE125 gp8 family phage protein
MLGSLDIVAGDVVPVVPPAALPLSLNELRAQCRLTDDDGSDQDALLMSYLRAAVDYAERYTSLGLITQTVDQTFSAFPTSRYQPARLKLRRRPLQSVEAVYYRDLDGAEVELASTVYNIRGVGSEWNYGSLGLALPQAWPSVAIDDEAVRVRYVVGFGDDHNSVPAAIRQALMMLSAYLFNQREAALIDPVILEVPFGVHALLDPWRLPGVA